MRTSGRSEIGQIAVVAAMFVAGLVTLPTAPRYIPMHWDANGNVNGYGDPLMGLFLVPGIALITYLLLRFLPVLDPGRSNYATFAGPYGFLRWVILLFLAGVDLLIHLLIRGVPADTGVIVPIGVGLLLILIGNVMGKIRPNWFVGVRTPWTLSSKRSWTRTHAVAGRVFVLMGAAFVLIPVARAFGIIRTSPATTAVGGFMVVAILYLFVYSYLVWRTDPERVPPAGTLPADRL